MDITYNEGLLLATYLEFFNRCYDPLDERRYEEGPGLFVRHIEMQNLAYFLKTLYVPLEYGFVWNWKCPYSSELQLALNGLDTKKEAIETFYTQYNAKRNRYHNRYSDQLEDTLADYLDNKNKTIAMASFVLEDVLTQDQGSEILAGMVYIGKTVHPGQNLSIILPELNRRGYYPSPELASSIWKALAILGIRDIDTKSFTRERTLKSNNDGTIL